MRVDPRATVVIPTRNRRAVLLEVIGAIVAQQGVDLEVIIVDEGSDDGTGDAIAALDDPRLRVVRHDVPLGLPAARNAGLAAATSRWIAFCDDDDLWAPTKLAQQIEAMELTDAAWACTGAVEVDTAHQVVGWQRVPDGGVTMADLLRRNVVPGGGSAVAMRTDVMRGLGGFDPSLRAAEDWEMWLRLREAGAPAVLDEPLVAYRIWPASMSRDLSRMDAATRRLQELHGVEPDRDQARYRIKQIMRNGRRVDAAAALVRLGLDPRNGELKDLLKAPVAALFPGWYLRTGFGRATAVMPDGWPEQAAAWIPDAPAARLAEAA